jgi:hypothetical protein
MTSVRSPATILGAFRGGAADTQATPHSGQRGAGANVA